MKAIFLDRDGTVIVDPEDERVDKVEKIELLPNTLEACAVFADLGYKVFFITNQAGMAEGRINMEEFQQINNEVMKRLQPSGLDVMQTYVCPHIADNCDCRKPSPKLILEAAAAHGIDLAGSYMIGDRLSDIMAGKNAGIKTILVKTGNKLVDAPQADYTADDLLEAAKYIADKAKL